jgi:ABC-type phosphate transport system substrate-binding protein
VTAADDGKLHVIPIAMGAISIMVHLPSGCTDYGSATLYHERPEIPATTLEKVFAGDSSADTWGEVIPGLDAGADCAGRTIKRVVRKDESGTSFALKQWLNHVNPARGWSVLANTAWPNDTGSTAVLRPAENGGGNLRTLLASEDADGGIGYADLSTSRGASGVFLYNQGAAYDDHIYLPLEIQKNTGVYRDPQASATGYTVNGTAAAASGGANCFHAVVNNQPASTLGDWSATDSTYSAAQTGEGDYGACTLTYDMAFEDDSTVYCNSAAEERKARTVKDFLEKGVVSDSGQASLIAQDYAVLPDDVLPKSRAGVAAIDWKKGTSGRPCTTPPPSGGGGGGGGGTTTVFVPVNTGPPPASISNAFTLSSVRFSKNRVRVTVQLPGAGTLTVSPTAKGKKGKSIRLSRSVTTISAAGTQRVSFSLNAKAKKALKRFKKIKVRVAVAFTPNGGSAARKVKTITVKAKRR